MSDEHPPKQPIHFIPGSGYATVHMFDKKKMFGFASPNAMLQAAGINQNIFFHISGYVEAWSRFRNETTYYPAQVPSMLISTIVNQSIFIPLAYRKDDGRFTARQWTINEYIHPHITYVTETIKDGLLLSLSESVVFVGNAQQCNDYIERNKDKHRGELAVKGPVGMDLPVLF